MEIGGVVNFRGRPWYVRGLDPHGVTPQYVYLEDARTGRRLAVPRDTLYPSGPARRTQLRLVEPDVVALEPGVTNTEVGDVPGACADAEEPDDSGIA